MLMAQKNCPEGKEPNDWGTCVPKQQAYTDELGIKSVRIHGAISVINAFLPMILFHAWIARKEWWLKTYNHVYWAAWQTCWVLHMLVYLYPAVLWGFTLISNKAKWLYVNWFKWMYWPVMGVVGLVGLLFFIAILDFTRTYETHFWEVFFVTVFYYGLGAVDIYFSILWYDYLIDWYPYKWDQTNDESTL